MPQTYGVPPNMSSAAPPPAPTATSPNTSRPGAGASRNALMGPQMTGGTHRIPGAMLEGLPPEFVQALFEIAELVDIDGDGQPDVAMVPLNQTGAQAAAGMGNALARPQGAPQPMLPGKPNALSF